MHYTSWPWVDFWERPSTLGSASEELVSDYVPLHLVKPYWAKFVILPLALSPHYAFREERIRYGPLAAMHPATRRRGKGRPLNQGQLVRGPRSVSRYAFADAHRPSSRLRDGAATRLLDRRAQRLVRARRLPRAGERLPAVPPADHGRCGLRRVGQSDRRRGLDRRGRLLSGAALPVFARRAEDVRRRRALAHSRGAGVDGRVLLRVPVSGRRS